MSESNTWLTEEGQRQIEAFLADSDVFIVERARALRLMIDLFSWNFPKPKGLSILDLGCGDGRWSKAFAERFPHNSFFLLDGSAAMLEKSKETMEGFNTTFVADTFEGLIGAEGRTNALTSLSLPWPSIISGSPKSGDFTPESIANFGSADCFSITTWCFPHRNARKPGTSPCGGTG